jgi:hypothetical protein
MAAATAAAPSPPQSFRARQRHHLPAFLEHGGSNTTLQLALFEHGSSNSGSGHHLLALFEHGSGNGGSGTTSCSFRARLQQHHLTALFKSEDSAAATYLYLYLLI